MMPDIATVIQEGAQNPWLYLPVALALGALHALEPGHSKSLMAAFIIAVRGTMTQAVLLGVSAAFGHTLVVWVLAIIGLSMGNALIAEDALPWLTLASGVLIMALALRVFTIMRPKHHTHEHADEADAAHCGHDHAHDIDAFKGRHVTNFDVMWFGFTGGLLPCPAAIAVLLICIQMREFTLGVTMVAAFSIGLAATLVAVGIVAAWGAHHAHKRWGGFDKISHRLPYVSAALIFCVGAYITLHGVLAL